MESASSVAAPVRSKRYTPRAKPLRPEPMSDTSSPNQTIKKVRMPLRGRGDIVT